jgi:hypothetical protein
MPPITPHSCYALHSTNQTIQSLQEMCDLYDSLLRTYERQSTLLYTDIDDNLRTIHLLLENHKSTVNSRTKRAVIPPIGDLLHWAFGVATVKDLNLFMQTIHALNKHVSSLQTNHNLVADDLSSFITLQNSRNNVILQKLNLTYLRTESLHEMFKQTCFMNVIVIEHAVYSVKSFW